MSTNNTKFIIFARETYGRLTEWLGSGLQNRLRRFESATDLNLKSDSIDIQYYQIFLFH